MELRLADRRDAEAIREIYNREVLESTATFDLVPRSLEDQQAWLAARSGARAAIVAVGADGEVVGFGSLSPWRDRPAYATTVEDSVYVHRGHQGQGVGRALLAELVEVATAHGFHACMARIVGGHDASIALHSVVASRSSAPSARWAGSSASGSTSCSWSGCSRDGRRHVPAAAAPAPSASRSAAPRNVTVAPDGARVAFLRSGGPEDPSPRCGCSTSRRARSTSWPIPAPCSPAIPPTCRPRSRPAGSGPGERGGDHRPMPPTPSTAWWRRRWPASWSWPTSSTRTAKFVAVPSAVIDPRPDPTGPGWPGSTGGRSGCPSSTTRRRRACSPARTTPRCGGGSPSSWPPRRWIATGATGGRPTARRSSPPGWTTHRCSGGGSPTPPTPIAARRRSPTPRRAPRTPTSPPGSSALDGTRREVTWDREDLPYLAEASLGRPRTAPRAHPRDQRRIEVRSVDPRSGATAALWTDHDDVWVERAPGTPARLPTGGSWSARDAGGTRRLLVGGTPVTPDDLHVRAVADVDADRVVFTANPVDDATGHVGVAVDRRRAGADHGRRRRPLRRRRRRHRRRPTRLARQPCSVRRRRGRPERGRDRRDTAGDPERDDPPRRRAPLGDRPPPPRQRGRRAVPRARRPVRGTARPARRAGSAAFLTSQWFADQGFAVVVVDGRGTPGRGTEWERAIRGDLAGPVLEDQVDGLLALAAEDDRLDLSRVAIRGWSFGGYLAALAVLRRPDVFHAAIAGAPVTEWRLYDTFYTERYLGDVDEDAASYDAQLAPARRRQARTPAAAHPRARRRQRRERPHPAAL